MSLPELAIGAGSVLICGVGFPASLASGFGGSVGRVNVSLWVGSELVTQLGVVLVYVFTMQVFRPGVAWARWVVACVACALPAALVVPGMRSPPRRRARTRCRWCAASCCSATSAIPAASCGAPSRAGASTEWLGAARRSGSPTPSS